MRILIANYRYFVSGGPETYMFAVSELLKHAGHEVVPFSVRYPQNRETSWSEYFVEPIAGTNAVYFRDHSSSPRALVRGFQRAFYARDVHSAVTALAAASRPEVALVLCYLRKLSPSVLVALKGAGVPVVVRLSDFGMVCPGGYMMRDGRVCRRCLTHGLSSSIRYRCVQGSFAVSAVAWASMRYALWRQYFDLVDYFITPSAVLREQMIQGGYDGSRILQLPTFVDAVRLDPAGVRQRRIAYVGRLSPEKGVHVLLDAFEKLLRRRGLCDLELHVAGEVQGPYAHELVARGQRISDQVKFLGMVDAEAVSCLLSGSLVSVVPSLWYENLPNTLLESLAAGTPVAASDLGSLREVLSGTDAGVLFRPGDSAELADSLASLLSQPDTLSRMSRSARALAETRHSPSAHLAGLLRVLDGAAKGVQRPVEVT